MQTQQKLGLAAFLCLQILMIILAIIRISGFVYHNAFDMGWVYLWQQIESCIAVSTISLTAFRIMFVASTSRRVRSPWQWTDSFKKRFYKRSNETTSTGVLDDVPIPGGTLTGMRTAIGGPRTQHTTTMFSIFDDEGEQYPLQPQPTIRPKERMRRADSVQRLSSPRFRNDYFPIGTLPGTAH